jgi:hypothetical protein
MLQKLWKLKQHVVKDVKVRSVTYTRKRPIEHGGNAEFILTADVQYGQFPEDVMRSLRNMAKVQLAEIKNEEGYDYYEQGTTDQNSGRY